MIQLHTSHGWLLPEAQQGGCWQAAQFFGGLAAPLFLLLAGAGLGLQWTTVPQHEIDRDTAGSLARGAELILLGYALRLQMWIIDGAAYARSAVYPGICLLAASYGIAYFCITRSARGQSCPRGLAIGACAAWLAGVAWAHAFDPTRAQGLIRVDVLQCIGASLMLLGALGTRGRVRRPGPYLALAACVALATPLVQRWVPGPLPSAVAGYLAQWPSAEGERVIALFPLLPWLGFAAIGAALGLAWGRARAVKKLDPLLLRVVAIGALLAVVTHPSWALARWLAPLEPLATLSRLTYKAGLCCALIGPALALARAPKAMGAPLASLGRSSLLVYWVHLELAFGTASRPVAHSLSIEAWAFGTVILVIVMWALARLRNTRRTLTIRAFWQRPVTG